MILKRVSLALATVLLALSFGTLAEARGGDAPLCVQEGLPPSVVCGRLDSGLRYVVQRNTAPAGAVSVLFAIQAGSMQEESDQHGTAHVLEHMAFHGSAHVGDGEMIRTLQRLGLRMGADLNATTSPTHTIYRFDIPKNDEGSLDTGLMLMREIASELKLDQAALDTERPIVQSEARLRNSAIEMAGRRILKAQIGDHPYGRAIIGTAEEIEATSLPRVRAFYEAYYRPDRAAVIVVGDIDPAAIAAKIAAKFSDWRGKGRNPSDPAPVGSTRSLPRYAIESAPGVPVSQISLYWRQPYRRTPTDRAEATRRRIEIVGFTAVRRRIMEENASSGLAFDSATGFSRQDVPGVVRSVSMGASVVHNLRATIDLLLKTRREIERFGLSQSEVDRAVAFERSALSFVGRATAQTAAIAQRIVGSIASGQPYETQQQSAAAFEVDVKGLTADRVNAVVRESIDGSGPVPLYIGPAQPEGGLAAIEAAIRAAGNEKIAAYAMPTAKLWKHTDFGPAGTVAQKKEDAASGATFVRFANGVRLSVKSTKFSAGEVHVNVRFGHGQLDLPRDRVAASDMASAMLNMSGLTDMTVMEMGSALAGRSVMALADMKEDAFTLSSGLGSMSVTQSPDLELQLQVMAALISSPGWRTDGWANLIESSAGFYAAMQANPAALFETASNTALHPGDLRWVQSTPEMQRNWKAEEAIAFIRPILESAPLEVIIVGDVPVDAAIAATAKTLGALPARRDVPESADLRKASMPGPRLDPLVVKHKGPLNQAIVAVGWPATDAFADVRQTQAARVLADVMRARAFDELRAKRGATYSPDASAAFSTIFPGYGYLSMTVTVRPEDVDLAFLTMDQIAADLAARPLPEDDLKRVLTPRIEASLRSRQTNGFWLSNLEDAQTDRRVLDMVLRAVDDLKSLTPADIQAAARRWLVKEKSFRIKVVPE